MLPFWVAHVGLKRRLGCPPRIEPIGLEGVLRPRERTNKDGYVMKLARRSTKNVAVVTAGGRMLLEKQWGDCPGLRLKMCLRSPENLLEVWKKEKKTIH